MTPPYPSASSIRRRQSAGPNHRGSFVRVRSERLLAQHVLARRNDVLHDIDVGEVRGDDHDGVDVVVGEQIVVVLIDDCVGRNLEASRTRSGVGIGDGDDARVVESEHVQDVFDAHHSGADDAVADGFVDHVSLFLFR